MDKEIYQALKKVVREAVRQIESDVDEGLFYVDDVHTVQGWIDEVAKEYDE